MSKLISIDNFAVRLDSVSIDLQNAYTTAERAVAAAPAGPIRNMAKNRLNEAAKNILIAATPHLMLKASPKFSGSRGFFEALNKRTA